MYLVSQIHKLKINTLKSFFDHDILSIPIQGGKFGKNGLMHLASVFFFRTPTVMGTGKPYMDDGTVKIQTNPLFDAHTVEAKNVTFSLEEDKNQSVKNVRLLKSQHKAIESLFPSSSGSFFPGTTLLLLRGSSYSLVELPTFLPPQCKVHPRPQCQCSLVTNKGTPLNDLEIQTLAEVLANYQPSDSALLRPTSQWTVMIVAIIFFTTCLLMVGVMLSFTTEYQDITVARLLNASDEIKREHLNFLVLNSSGK